MNRRTASTVILFLLLTLLISVPVFAANSDIIVSEVMYDAAGEQWVEIYNKGPDTVDLLNWQICEAAGCDTIATSTLNIGAGQYFLITDAANNAALTTEFGNYTNTPSVIDAQTVYLGEPIGGNGLDNNDYIYLVSDESICGPGGASPCVSDCINYDPFNGTNCADIDAYYAGSDGADVTGLNNPNTDQHQSIINIQGEWCHSTTAEPSPYADNEEETTGACSEPTAVSLNGLGGSSGDSWLWIVLFGLTLFTGGSWLAWRRR